MAEMNLFTLSLLWTSAAFQKLQLPDRHQRQVFFSQIISIQPSSEDDDMYALLFISFL